MKKLTILLAALVLAGCATTDDGERPDPVADFIEVSDLEKVSAIKSIDQLESYVLDEYYVIVKARKAEYLLVYYSRCQRDSRNRVTPDRRYDARALYAKSDTYRGCRIKAIYALSDAQAQELREIDTAGR